MSYSTCKNCLDKFWREDGEEWKQLCFPCWKKSKRTKTVYSSGNRNTGIDARLLLQQIALWRERAIKAETYIDQHQCPDGFDLATLKRIRLLVHPDKHGGSSVANEISQRINQMIREAS